jgi:hypothetical protein
LCRRAVRRSGAGIGAFSSQGQQLPESYFQLSLCNLGTLFPAFNVAGTVLAAALLIAVVIGGALARILTAAVIPP